MIWFTHIKNYHCAQNPVLLWYNTVTVGKQSPSFQDNVVALYSRVRMSYWTLRSCKNRPLYCLEELLPDDPLTQYYVQRKGILSFTAEYLCPKYLFTISVSSEEHSDNLCWYVNASLLVYILVMPQHIIYKQHSNNVSSRHGQIKQVLLQM
jgi:hypothetical protein